MAQINAKKISDLIAEDAIPETDFVEISRDNGDSTFSSFKSPVSSIGGGGSTTSGGYMLGEIRYFSIEPGADWLKLDGSEIDQTQFPELAAQNFTKSVNPGDYLSHTLNTYDQKIYDNYYVSGCKDLRYIESSNEILLLHGQYQFENTINGRSAILDCDTQITREITFNVDGVQPTSTINFSSTTSDYNGDTFGIIYYESSTSVFKITGGFANKTGVINLEIIAPSPINITSPGFIAPFASDETNGLMALYYSNTLYLSQDAGMTFSQIDATDISNLLEAAPVEHLEFANNFLYMVEVSTDGIMMSISVDDVVDLANNGETASNTGNGIIYPGYVKQDDTYRYSYKGKFISETGSAIVGMSENKISIMPDSDGSILSISNFYNGSFLSNPGSPYPAGNGFFFTLDKLNSNVSVYYVDANQGIVEIDLAASPATTSNDPIGWCIYSSVSERLFVFYRDSSSAYLSASIESFTSYDITLSDTVKRFLPNYPRKGGTFAYVKAVL